MKKLLVVPAVGLLMFVLTACPSTGTGTRDDPILYKDKGDRCTTVGAFAKTSGGELLQCGTDTNAGQRVPHWNPTS